MLIVGDKAAPLWAQKEIKRLESELAESKRKHNECFTDMTSHLEAERAKVMELEAELAECKAAKERTVDQVYALYDTLDILKDENKFLRARCEMLEDVCNFVLQNTNYIIFRSNPLVASKISDIANKLKQALEVPK